MSRIIVELHWTRHTTDQSMCDCIRVTHVKQCNDGKYPMYLVYQATVNVITKHTLFYSCVNPIMIIRKIGHIAADDGQWINNRLHQFQDTDTLKNYTFLSSEMRFPLFPSTDA